MLLLQGESHFGVAVFLVVEHSQLYNGEPGILRLAVDNLRAPSDLTADTCS